MTRKVLITLATSLILAGCGATYVTPGPAAVLVDGTDYDLKEFYRAKPVSPFPANVAIVRIQGSDYFRRSDYRYPSDQYAVVTTRDIESDDAIGELVKLPMVNQIAPLGRHLLEPETNSIEDLRVPAARLQSDMLLIYSVETSFSVEGKSFGPLTAISLGFIRNKKAHVTSTVAGTLVDVRTGFIYGTTEASATESKGASVWSTEQAINTSRLRAESDAFEQFVDEFKGLWKGVVEQHAATSPQAAAQVEQPALADNDRSFRIRFEN